MRSDEALERLHAILAQPDFKVEQSRTWWDRIWSAATEPVVDGIGQLVRLLTASLAGQEGWLGLAAVGLASIVLLLGALAVIRAIRLTMVRELRLGSATRAERRQRSDQLFREAERLAAEGRFAEATRAAYLSALYALDERALLRFQGGLTNREHAAQLRREHPELGESFAELVQGYDRVRYGHYPVTADAFAQLSGLAARARARAVA